MDVRDSPSGAVLPLGSRSANRTGSSNLLKSSIAAAIKTQDNATPVHLAPLPNMVTRKGTHDGRQ